MRPRATQPERTDGNKLAGMGVSAADQTGKGTRFENHVACLLEMLGFTVERDLLVNGRQVDLVAIDSRGPVSSRYLVECKDQAHKVTTPEFDSFQGRVQGVRNNGDPRMGGLFITTTGFVKEAKAQAASLGIDLIHIAELERSLVDLAPLVSAQLNELREERGVVEFVEPKLRLDGRIEARPALPAIREWLYNRHKNQLTLLGDFGVGKTTLLRQLAVELGERFLESRLSSQGAPAPIYVDLRQEAEPATLQQTISTLFGRYCSSPYSYELFWQFCREGRVLILLDGFDELASRTDAEVTIESFREINRPLIGRSKLILTCRTHYFIDDAQVHDFHGEHERTTDPVYSELYQEIAGRPNSEIRHLEDFNPEQITSLIRNRLGGGAEAEVWQVLNDHYNLADLARRPVLLDMILDSLDRIREESGEVTSALLYQVYTNIWLKRNDWKTSVDPEVRAVLIEEFALRMMVSGSSRLHHSEFPALIRRARPDLDEVDIGDCDRELRRAGFLIRDSSGSYRFAHRSFQEFFFARYLVRTIRSGQKIDPLVLKAYRKRITSEVYRFVCDMVRRDDDVALSGAQLIQSGELDDPTLWLLIKFVSRSQHPAVIDALTGLVEDLKSQSVPEDENPRAFFRARHLAVAVTALGWLRRGDDPTMFVKLLNDQKQPYMVRHNALVAVCRSEHPQATKVVCRFVAECKPLTGAILLSSRIIQGIISSSESTDLADAVLDRWINDKRFAAKWERAENLTALCTMCEHAEHEQAQDVLRRLTLSPIPRAIASAVMALDQDALEDVEEGVLAKAQSGGPWWRLQPPFARAVTRFNSVAATDLLLEMAESGKEAVGEIALKAVCERDPNRAHGLVYGGLDPWRGKHWSSRLRLISGELLQAHCPDDVFADIWHLLNDDRFAGPEAYRALELLARLAPSRFRDVVERMFELNHPAAAIAFACELLYEVDQDAGREVALGLGLTARKPSRRLRTIELLRADDSDAVTEALLRQIPSEETPEVRSELARALISPGRGVPGSRLERLVTAEEDREVREILELGLYTDASTGELGDHLSI